MKFFKNKILWSSIIGAALVSSCVKTDNTITFGELDYTLGAIGPTLETIINGFKFSNETNPTNMNYNITGSAVNNCSIQYIATGQNYINGTSSGVTQVFNSEDKDFLVINCRAAPSGSYVANVYASFSLGGETYQGSKSYTITVP
ncbi:hypothetical protein LO80_06065 [Candidatus Francisella endociliophora]|uniref:Lipoprotein n=1 Tax=Candidatus Francisella endociliophora TaxID=653937 RepID=A0A097EPS6_9GAMM|nr:hypothetical protein [Francisella sp. FSC1006]AIT09570.1 hypothetical protein LO80_06065 [Francisella sp. FSC1006]